MPCCFHDELSQSVSSVITLSLLENCFSKHHFPYEYFYLNANYVLQSSTIEVFITNNSWVQVRFWARPVRSCDWQETLHRSTFFFFSHLFVTLHFVDKIEIFVYAGVIYHHGNHEQPPGATNLVSTTLTRQLGTYANAVTSELWESVVDAERERV